MKRSTQWTHAVNQCAIGAAWIFPFNTLLLFGWQLFTGWKHLSAPRVRRKEISTSCYVLLHHNLMTMWDVLIDTRYFTLAAPWGIATHSDEYRLPSLITRYVRTNRLSTILPLRIAGNTASEVYGSIARAARVALAIAPVHPVLSPRLEECEYSRTES